MICLFFEIVDSSPAPADESLTVVGGPVETGHEGSVAPIDFAERTVVHLVEKQPVLALESDPAFERIPETHQPKCTRRVRYMLSSIPGSPAVLL